MIETRAGSGDVHGLGGHDIGPGTTFRMFP